MPLGALTIGDIIGGIAAAGTVAQGIGALTASNNASSQSGFSQTTFNEQQGFEKQLAALIANPSSVTSLPGYQFQFDQGAQAVARYGAATSGPGSGASNEALITFGQGLAQNFYTTQANLLASLAGLAPASPAQYGSNAIAAQSSASNQFNNFLGEAGMLSGLYGGSLGTNTGITPGEQMWLLSGSPGGPGPTISAGGGYTYNNPGYTGP